MEQIVKDCINQALVYLTIREHNQVELETKLKNKKYELSVIEKAVTFLKEEGSLSEERYAESFIRSSNRRHPEGKSMIYARLLSKGCDKFVARQVADEMYSEQYIKELIESAAERIKKKGKQEELKTRLFKLGFSSSDIALIGDSL